jgi:hypothetical protein
MGELTLGIRAGANILVGSSKKSIGGALIGQRGFCKGTRKWIIPRLMRLKFIPQPEMIVAIHHDAVDLGTSAVVQTRDAESFRFSISASFANRFGETLLQFLVVSIFRFETLAAIRFGSRSSTKTGLILIPLLGGSNPPAPASFLKRVT